MALVPLVVTVLAALATLLAWAVSSPPSSEADGDFHLISAWCRSDAASGLCPAGAPIAESAVGVALVSTPPFVKRCFAFRPDRSGRCDDAPATQQIMSAWLYPPLFYEYVSTFAASEPDQGIIAMRFGVILSVVAIFTAAYLVSLSWLRPAMVVSWVVFAMPFGLSVMASINPSAWAIAGLAAMWGPMVTACRTSGRKRWLAVAVWLVAGLMAAGARADAGIAAALISAGGAALLFRRWSVVPLLAAAFGSGLFLGLALASGQASFASKGLLDQTQDPQGPAAILWSVVLAAPTYLSGLTAAPWGFLDTNHLLGWFDVPMPPGVWVPTTMLLGMLGAAGLVWMPWRKVVALATLTALGLVLISRGLLQDQVLAGTLFSPRYVLPLALVALGLLLVVGPRRRIGLTGWPFWIAYAATVYIGAVAFHSSIRRYVTGVDVVSANLDDRVEWWSLDWLSPNAVWLLGTLAWAGLAFAALSHLRAVRRPAAPRASRPASASGDDTVVVVDANSGLVASRG